jgi:hypothetical protein
MLSVIMLIVVMQRVVMARAVILSSIIQNGIWLGLIMPIVVMVCGIMLNLLYTECHNFNYAECCYTECHNADCHGAKPTEPLKVGSKNPFFRHLSSLTKRTGLDIGRGTH